jgi:hypothetical protein
MATVRGSRNRDDETEEVHRRFKHPCAPLHVRPRDKESITQTIERLMNDYAEDLVKFQKKLTAEGARKFAAERWRAELPELADFNSVLCYIALIAWGQRLHILQEGEAKLMMFTAQTQLTALSRAEDAREAAERRTLRASKAAKK